MAVWSPLAMLHHASLTMHMTQHLLLMTVAAPLILTGSTSVPLPGPLGEFAHRALGLGRRLPLLRNAGQTLTHPACCWLAGTLVVIAWHVPAIFLLGMQSHGWRAIQQASFVAAGVCFLVARHSAAAGISGPCGLVRTRYLFAATLPCDALSGFLVFCDRVVYSSYL